jgi:hypothetical protein
MVSRDMSMRKSIPDHVWQYYPNLKRGQPIGWKTISSPLARFKRPYAGRGVNRTSGWYHDSHLGFINTQQMLWQIRDFE